MRTPTRWSALRRAPRRSMLALAAVCHLALLLALLHWQGRLEQPVAVTLVETTIWTPAPRTSSPPRQDVPTIAAHAPARRAPTPITALPLPSTPPSPATARTPAIASLPVPVASPPQPPASAASAPLRLTLTPSELRALEAEASGSRTLAQRLAGGPRLSALQQLGGEESGIAETPLPGGVTEVHVHGGCFRMVPTQRSQADPFNHSGERLPGPCLPHL